jgi:Cd2+/Zn2+-exporting ATPase
MTGKPMKKYRITGLDCASCANEIETKLRKVEGFDGASVSYATETITIPATGLERARQIVSDIEPEANIVNDGGSGDGTRAGLDRRVRRIVRMVASVLLLGAGILFRSTLQETPYQLGEYAVFLLAYALAGAPVVMTALRNIVRGRVFDEMFLMTVATIGAIAIGELAEAVAVMLFYAVGEYVQDLAVGRSRSSITSLLALRPDSARVVEGSELSTVSPEEVSVGATIEVRSGERVPLDGKVIDGESFVDTSALTGESVPRSVAPGDEILSGFVNESGTLRVEVAKEYSESSVARILELVENAAAHKAPTERFISKFAAVYTPIVVGIAAAIAFLPPLLVPGASLNEWVYRALVALVISCPCALVISIPLGYFGGIGGASRAGILVKGANFMDTMTDVRTVVMDKTGTLTKGVFQVAETVGRNGFTEEDVLRLAAHAETHSSHPIARSIRDAYWGASATAGETAGDPADPAGAVTDVREEKGFGVSATVGGRKVVAGSDRILHREKIPHEDSNIDGTVVHVAVDGTYAGYLTIADEIRPDAHAAVEALKASGINDLVMLTGDNEAVAQRVARELGIDRVHSELLPDEKVARLAAIEEEQRGGSRVAFVGDGINDAPVLTRSDVGFAMGALGSDAAIEAADVVVMDDRLECVPRALSIARQTRRIVLQNIGLALVAKSVFLVLGAAGIATMWEAVIADVGVTIVAVLNATRALRAARA